MCKACPHCWIHPYFGIGCGQTRTNRTVCAGPGRYVIWLLIIHENKNANYAHSPSHEKGRNRTCKKDGGASFEAELLLGGAQQDSVGNAEPLPGASPAWRGSVQFSLVRLTWYIIYTYVTTLVQYAMNRHLDTRVHVLVQLSIVCSVCSCCSVRRSTQSTTFEWP